MILRVERHPLGPRLHVLGLRIHEWHAGAAVLGLLAGLLGSDVLDWGLGALGLAVLGSWLVIKDWPDLVPTRRDTAAWGMGLHRPPLPLRIARRGAWVPPLAAAAAGVTAIANLVSTLTPDIAARAELLHDVVPLPVGELFHALAVPASAALGVTAVFLARRRRRAAQLAVVLLLVLGALDMLKGLDAEEAAMSWAAAALLVWARPAFHVRGGPVRVSTALRFAVLLLGGTLALAGVATWVAMHEKPGVGLVTREAADLLLWRHPPVALHGHAFVLLPIGIGLVSLFALVAGGFALFRAPAAPKSLPDADARRAAMHLVRAHGSDSLAFFKLRGDKQYLFSGDGRAFCGYRIVHGVLLVSGDPVGPAEAIPGLVKRLFVLAERHGLPVGVVGAGEDTLPVWHAAGLRTVYLGDEAVVETAKFSLEGRKIRKVRQSVSRMTKAGYTIEFRRQSDLSEAEIAKLEQVSEEWLGGDTERGFAMAMDTLRGDHQSDAMIVVARNGDGRPDAFLHFVPFAGGEAMSLGFMRRRPETPNGLTEYLVVKAIELMRDEGVRELSLNFCAFGRWLREPANPAQRLVKRIVPPLDHLFQIKSLLDFNEKFFPRWDPRYIAFSGWTALPRTVVAALEAEGQLPKPAVPKLVPRAALRPLRRAA